MDSVHFDKLSGYRVDRRLFGKNSCFTAYLPYGLIDGKRHARGGVMKEVIEMMAGVPQS